MTDTTISQDTDFPSGTSRILSRVTTVWVWISNWIYWTTIQLELHFTVQYLTHTYTQVFSVC
jgi:hypothetical protein